MIMTVLTVLVALAVCLVVVRADLLWARYQGMFEPARAAELHPAPTPNTDAEYTLEGARVWLPPDTVSDAVWNELCPPPRPQRTTIHGHDQGYQQHVANREPMCRTCLATLMRKALAQGPKPPYDTVTLSLPRQDLPRQDLLRLSWGRDQWDVQHCYPIDSPSRFNPLPWSISTTGIGSGEVDTENVMRFGHSQPVRTDYIADGDVVTGFISGSVTTGYRILPSPGPVSE